MMKRKPPNPEHLVSDSGKDDLFRAVSPADTVKFNQYLLT